jgi:hypothetical protein
MDAVTTRWESAMKLARSRTLSLLLLPGCLASAAGTVMAQPKGPPDDLIRGAFREVLAAADRNRDGKLTLDECMAISKDKKKIEKDCRYWDADADGTITEDEYVRQVRKIMK